MVWLEMSSCDEETVCSLLEEVTDRDGNEEYTSGEAVRRGCATIVDVCVIYLVILTTTRRSEGDVGLIDR